MKNARIAPFDRNPSHTAALLQFTRSCLSLCCFALIGCVIVPLPLRVCGQLFPSTTNPILHNVRWWRRR